MTKRSISPRLVSGIVAALVAAFGSLSGCGDSVEPSFPDLDLESGGPGSRIAVAAGPDAPEGEGLGLTAGETHWSSPEPRRSMLTILRGEYDRGDETPFSAELVRTVDAELPRDLDPKSAGPDQWVTRAKVLDADGDVIWKRRILSLYDLVEYLRIVLDESAPGDFTISQVFTLGKSDFPNLFEFPVRVPLGLEGAAEYVLEVPDENGELYTAARFSIERLLRAREAPRFEPEIREVRRTGPPEQRIDVVILGDGYVADEREEFFGDARAIAERFQRTKPFDRHADLFNFRAAWTPSRESGAGYDCEGPKDSNCKRDFRDTVFRYTFAVSALIDMFNLDIPEASARVAFPIDVAKMYEVAAPAKYDEIILLSNTDRRSGFGAMEAAVLTAFDDRHRFPDVAIHEFGHTFGLLGDEYFIPSDPCLFRDSGETLPPNVAADASYDRLKWNHWVDESTPLPTPDRLRDRHEIGAYEKARNCSFLYRPAYRCKMRSSSGEFCAVCNEQLTRRLYDDVDLLRDGHPAIRRQADGDLRFESGVRMGGRLAEIQWRLDGMEVGAGPGLELTRGMVPAEWTRLVLSVSEDSGNVRIDDPRLRAKHTWWVRAR